MAWPDKEQIMKERPVKLTGLFCLYFDTGKKPFGTEPEHFYHGFVLGLMVELSDQYALTSNRESGSGRYDIMLESKKALIGEAV